MLIPKKARVDILSYLFKEGVLVAEKNLYAKHPDIDVPNLYVINVMKSMRSRKFVRESFTWNHYYWYLNNDGINYLREFLHLPEEIVPATLKKKPTQLGERMERDRPFGGRGGGDRPGGFRGTRPFGQQKDAGVDADFKPSFGGNKPTGMGRGNTGGQ